MNKHLLKHAIVFAAVLTAGGCATTSGKTGALNTSASDAVNGIGDASIGDIVTVTPSENFDESSVIVATEYTAASGRLCRRLQTTEGMSLPRVVCKSDSGKWTWARDLVPASKQSNNKQTELPHSSKHNHTAVATDSSAKAVVSDVTEAERLLPADVADELNLSALKAEDGIELDELDQSANATELAAGEIAILPNETLWTFAKRTTGNALNWQRIAELNGIEDTRTIVNGEILQVPVELLRDGD